MQLLEDGERLRVVTQRLHLPTSVVGRLWSLSYQETGECTRRHGPGRSRLTTRRQDRFLVLLSLRNQMSTAKSLEINFRHAAEVHLPYQTVRNRINNDCTRAR